MSTRARCGEKMAGMKERKRHHGPGQPELHRPPVALYDDAAAALSRVRTIYDGSVDHLRTSLQAFVNGERAAGRVRATYPFVRVHTDTVARADSRLSYGFVAGPGPTRRR